MGGLIAEVLPRLWARDPERGRQQLDEVRLLTRGALAEMRTLLLELRPAALVEAGLEDLHIAALEGDLETALAGGELLKVPDWGDAPRWDAPAE
mgnify:CR=1 FL=1